MGGLGRMVWGAFALYSQYRTMVSLVAPAAGGEGSMPGAVWPVAACCDMTWVSSRRYYFVSPECVRDVRDGVRAYLKVHGGPGPAVRSVLAGRREPWRRRRRPPHEQLLFLVFRWSASERYRRWVQRFRLVVFVAGFLPRR